MKYHIIIKYKFGNTALFNAHTVRDKSGLKLLPEYKGNEINVDYYTSEDNEVTASLIGFATTYIVDNGTPSVNGNPPVVGDTAYSYLAFEDVLHFQNWFSANPNAPYTRETRKKMSELFAFTFEAKEGQTEAVLVDPTFAEVEALYQSFVATAALNQTPSTPTP